MWGALRIARLPPRRYALSLLSANLIPCREIGLSDAAVTPATPIITLLIIFEERLKQCPSTADPLYRRKIILKAAGCAADCGDTHFINLMNGSKISSICSNASTRASECQSMRRGTDR
jgi:hypothetical protein